ncbi:MAG: ATP-binding protein [Candidatus Symbiothrix sp.]|jgi:hypothetical protein|nr:ATP-binding protein [Candidatus Symbiothrix sp.]
MATSRKKLPIGIQNFEALINENYTYVDKTRYLVEMIDTGHIYFLSRPRRFGKSLTVSTFDAMFSGKKELFKGLYAEEFMNRADYHASPVIRLDMSRVNTSFGIEELEKSLRMRVCEIAQDYQIELDNDYASSDLLQILIKQLATKHGKVVILLDEYDKPYVDFFTQPEKAEQIRGILRNFYVQLKANDEYIRFVFITGISKFARFGVFSGLNSPEDISLTEYYGEFLGYSEDEIVKYFPDDLKETAEKRGVSVDALLDRMRYYYDGFCFDGIHKLYNPFSTINFFKAKSFDNFWMESGTTKLITDYLKTHKLSVEQFHNIQVSRDFARSPGDMDSTPPEGFLYQGGYLTISRAEGDFLALDYPNTEVLNSMSRLVSEIVCKRNDDDFAHYRSDLLAALSSKNKDKLSKVFNCLLASIPYDDFRRGAERNISDNIYEFPLHEWHYRSMILAFVRGCGVAAVAEMHTNLGRADLVLDYLGNVWVIEIKVAYKPEDVPAKLAEAKAQIIDGNYTAPYPNATAIAMVIDDTKREITEGEIIEN